MKAIYQWVLLAMVFWPAVCEAHPDQNNQFFSMGAGQVSCGEWNVDRSEKNEPSFQMFAWALGFLSGYNAFGPGSDNIAKGTDLAGLEGWLDKYCAEHPLDPFGNAGQALINELKKKEAP